jgi:hypothetical protein
MDGDYYIFLFRTSQIPQIIHALGEYFAASFVSYEGFSKADNDANLFRLSTLETQAGKASVEFYFSFDEKVDFVGLEFVSDPLSHKHSLIWLYVWSGQSVFADYASWRNALRFVLEKLEPFYGFTTGYDPAGYYKDQATFEKVMKQRVLASHATLFLTKNSLQKSFTLNEILENAAMFHHFESLEKFIWVEFFLPFGGKWYTNETPHDWYERDAMRPYYEFWDRQFEKIRPVLLEEIGLSR